VEVLDRAAKDADELLQKKLQRMKEVTSVDWKGDRTAKIMQFGFGFLEKDRSILETLCEKEIKRFFDTICYLL
jgi:hypothetical protein